MALKLDIAVGTQIVKHTPGIQAETVQPVKSLDIIPPSEHRQISYTRVSRILPFINVERMKQTASLLPPEDQEKYKSSVGLNINAAQFTIGKFA